MLQNIKGIGPTNRLISQPASWQQPKHTKMAGDHSSIQTDLVRPGAVRAGSPLHEQLLLSKLPEIRLYER